MDSALATAERPAEALSLTGRKWIFREGDDRLAQALAQRYGLPDVLAGLLAARGVALEEAEHFLNPSLKALLPDPSHLLDMDVAAERVAGAVMSGERIAIFGDYDVDGATSSALLARYLRTLGNNPIVYIPDRMKEGYGPNAAALLALKERGAALVITVDCGTLAFEPLAAAHAAGLDVIVIDHHAGEAQLPKAFAVVNPNRLDESSPHRQLAAVGVAFLLVVAVNRQLRRIGFFSSARAPGSSSPIRGEVRRGASRESQCQFSPHPNPPPTGEGMDRPVSNEREVAAHSYPISNILKNARELRANMTDAEQLLWRMLREEQLGAKFRKQHPIGNYIADFACFELKLIIELDGGQHNGDGNIKRDKARTAFLEREGFTVLRFWNNEVLQNTDGVLETVYGEIQSRLCPPPNLPPIGGGVTEPDPRQWLDIVALGTICDVVPLTGVNRALAAQGLKVMAARGNLGLRTVFDLASIAEKPGVYHAGFVVGPRINAGGRVGRSDLGVRLLTTEDEAEALMLARELEQHNAERKAIEAMVLEQAMAQAEATDIAAPFLMVTGQGWHPGVIGIVAGRLKERFHKPVAVVACADGIGKASARSVHGLDFGAAVIAARQAGLLLAGGGHAMAAGFTVEERHIPALAEFLAQRLQLPEGEINPGKRLFIDGAVAVGGATVELAESLERLGPFGQGNPAVRLVIHNAVNLRPEWTGSGEHLKTLLIDRLSNARLSAIAFRAANTRLAEMLLATRGREISVAGQLRLSEWNGRPQVSLMIEDAA